MNGKEWNPTWGIDLMNTGMKVSFTIDAEHVRIVLVVRPLMRIRQSDWPLLRTFLGFVARSRAMGLHFYLIRATVPGIL